MNTRRSFFSRFGAAIATIALAPELAFRAKLALPEVEQLNLEEVFAVVYTLKRVREHLTNGEFRVLVHPEADPRYSAILTQYALGEPLPYSELQRLRKEANAV